MENPAILSGAADIPDNRGTACRHDLQAFAAEKTKARTNRAFVQDLAERTGLEPATPGVTGRYSNRLNYRSVSVAKSARD